MDMFKLKGLKSMFNGSILLLYGIINFLAI